MIFVIVKIDAISKAINDALSRTPEAPLCLVVGSTGFVVVGETVGGVIVEDDDDVGNDDREVGAPLVALVVDIVTVIVAVVVTGVVLVLIVTVIV